jgi:2-polyprenyl-3-methyl-5-hydroxy-6-metoxy-1,4-benzoquinol methylase
MADMTNTRACPVCGNTNAAEWMRKDQLRIVKCAECAMCYVPQNLDAAVGKNYYESTADEFYTSDDKIRGDYATHRYDREIAALTRFCRGGKVLDVGCSTGGFLHQTALRYPGRYQLFGTDVAKSALNVAEDHGCATLPIDFLSPEFPEGSFDAITFWAVLEHLNSPFAYLEKARRLLNPSGLCFIVVPNVNSLAIRLIGKRYRYILPEHLNYFSRNTLLRLAEKFFEPVAISTSHFNPIVILRDFTRNSQPKPRERAELLNRTNHWKEMKALSPLQLGYRCFEKLLSTLGLCDNLIAVFRAKS